MMLFVFVNILLTALLCSCAFFGDIVGYKINYYNRLRRALIDNGVHATIGGLTWLIVCVNVHRKAIHFTELGQILGCFILASVIDFDHFITAKSLKLQDATNLSQRPFMHSTTLVIAFGVCLILLSTLYPSLHPWGWIWLAASLSHHTRDAVRRGYSIHPWGETPPIPNYLYLILIALIPQFIGLCVFYTKPNNAKRINNNVDYWQFV